MPPALPLLSTKRATPPGFGKTTLLSAWLQLAALSMRNRSDGAEFIRSLSGTHAHLADYFIEEMTFVS